MNLRDSAAGRPADLPKRLRQVRDMKTDRTANPEPSREDLSVSEVVRDFLTTAVLAIDEQRRVNLFNPAAEPLTLLKAEEVLNRPLEVLPLSLAEIINETLVSGRAIIDRQITFPANNPRGCDVRVSTTVARTSALGRNHLRCRRVDARR